MIANPDFALGGPDAGQAGGWKLRSVCARERVAAFAPAEAIEGFARWTGWTGALGGTVRAPFAPTAAEERFDAWPLPLVASELTGGLVLARATDGFEAAWWQGAPRFRWDDVAQAAGAFASGARETFDPWRRGETFLLAFADAALSRGVFHSAPSELFDGAVWPTKNLTV